MGRELVDDTDLWNRIVKSGDAAAFRLLYERHSAALLRISRASAATSEVAADAVQDAFVTLWSSRRRVAIFGPSVLPWLIVTVRFTTLKGNRREQRGRAHEAELMEAAKPDHSVRSLELRMSLDAAVAGLSALDQAIVQRCLVDGLTYASAAEELGVPVGSVRNRLSRLRRHLQIALSE